MNNLNFGQSKSHFPEFSLKQMTNDVQLFHPDLIPYEPIAPVSLHDQCCSTGTSSPRAQQHSMGLAMQSHTCTHCFQGLFSIGLVCTNWKDMIKPQRNLYKSAQAQCHSTRALPYFILNCFPTNLNLSLYVQELPCTERCHP